MPYELAALLTALIWAIGSIIAADLARDIGGITFNRLRSTSVFLMLVVFVSFMSAWHSIQQGDWGLILLSGFIGIALGDSALFTCLQRLGPRLSHMLYACNAPLTVLMSIVILGKPLPIKTLLGVVLVFGGVVLAIAWGKKKGNSHRWEQVQGTLWLGIVFGLLGALGQALGAIIIKPVMDHGADPIAVTALRIGTGALALNLYWLRAKRRQAISQRRSEPLETSQIAIVRKVTVNQIALSALNGFLSLGVGLSLLMYAFSKGDVGVASILSATTPVMILPVLWLKTGQRPALGAWIGAGLAVIGIALIL